MPNRWSTLSIKGWLFLGILTICGLSLYLIGPSILNKDLVESKLEMFTLEPYENKTINLPFSYDQILIVISAKNLIVENNIVIEVSGSGKFAIYKQSFNTTETLVTKTSIYNSIISNPKLLDHLTIENATNQTITIQAKLEHKLTVKMADFTLPHVGFIIFIITLLTLQIITLKTTKHTVIEKILSRLALASDKKNFIHGKSEIPIGCGIVLEVFFPILLLFLSSTMFLIYGYKLRALTGYSSDYLARIVLIGMSLAYFFSAILHSLSLTFRTITIRILKKRNPDFLKMHETFSKLHTSLKIIAPSIFSILIIDCALIIYGLDFWAIFLVTIPICMTLYALIYYLEIKKGLVDKTLNEEERQKLTEFIEIDAKTIGFWILGILTAFAFFTLMIPAFSSLTTNLFILDYYPSFLMEICENFTLWVGDIFSLLGQLQVPICSVLTIPYWITRVIICKFKTEYSRKLLTDAIIFLIVFAISEYLKWTTYLFTESTHTYNITNLPNSILIGMTASILKDLLVELLQK